MQDIKMLKRIIKKKEGPLDFIKNKCININRTIDGDTECKGYENDYTQSMSVAASRYKLYKHNNSSDRPPSRDVLTTYDLLRFTRIEIAKINMLNELCLFFFCFFILTKSVLFVLINQ